MESVPASATKTFETDETVQAYNKAGSVIQQFTIPSSLKHFEAGTEEGTLRRQAISMAINRENICDKVLNGTGTPAVDFTSSDPGLLRLPQGQRESEVQREEGQGTLGEGQRHQPVDFRRQA